MVLCHERCHELMAEKTEKAVHKARLYNVNLLKGAVHGREAEERCSTDLNVSETGLIHCLNPCLEEPKTETDT